MYKVLLADDEGIALDSLRFLIEKNFANECSIQTAKTGRAVIEAAESFRPEIAVMDIQMPGINGIEAMKEIKQFCPECVFIVLSAYDKFDYAKEAINLGVLEYLTKPLQKDNFLATFGRAIELIDQKKQRRGRDLQTREKLETVVPVIEHGFISSLLMQEEDSINLEQYKNLLNITVENGFMLLIEAGEESLEESSHQLGNPIGSGVRIHKYYSQIREIVKEYVEGAIVGQIMSNRIPVLIPKEEDALDYNSRITLISRLQELSVRLEEKTDVSFHIGIGKVMNLLDIKESYRQASNSLKTGTEPISHAEDLPVSCEYEEGYPIELENELFTAVKSGNYDEANTLADRFFLWMENAQIQNMSSVRLKALEFVLFAEHYAYFEGGMGVYRFNDRKEYLGFVQSSNITELHSWFVTKITEATTQISSKSSKRADSVIITAKKFIDRNYKQDISLDDVSREVNVSPYYFSKLFKDEAGVTFIEYLTTLRIGKAKELLMQEDASIKDICVEVGYQDPNYFSRIFKRYTGKTPTEYKEQGD